jgi:hypothetical protein
MKFALYGVRQDQREMLATFESEKQALEYVENSMLYCACNPNFFPDTSKGKYRYKEGSLLREWDGCEIDTIKFEQPQ